MEFINVKNIDSNVDNSLNVNNKLNKYKHSNFVDFVNKSNKAFKNFKLQNATSPEAQTALHTVQRVLKMNISSTDYKDNGKLDIMGIIRKHGDKLTTRDTKDFKDSLMILLNNGLIESHDYFEVVKWISIKSSFKKVDDDLEDELVKSVEELDPKSEYR